MKILHITNSISEGGVGTYLLSLLPALKKIGHSVELLALDKNNTDLAFEMERQNIKVHIGKYKNVYDLRNIFFIRLYIKRGNYDIIHTHLFPTQYFFAIARMSEKSNVKVITTEHTNYNKRRNYVIFLFLERMIYKQYDVIVACSNDAANNLKRWLNHVEINHKINAIVNGINLRKFIEATKYSKQELNLPNNAKILIMVARFSNQKDHKTVIRAVTLLDKSIHVLFCGSGKGGINECCRLARTLGVDKRIHFLGNRTDIPKLLRSSDIAILSSFYEGMPLSLMEYMAAGLPSVCTNVDGSREFAQNYGILFPVGDYQCLASEITLLLENKEYYNEVAQRCYNRVQDFSEDKMISNYLSLYNGLLCKTN